MNQEDIKNVGTRIRKIRKRLRMNQGDFCRSLNITAGYLSGIENGKGNPGIKFFVDLANRYKVSMDYLFHGIGKMFIDEKIISARDSNEILDDINDLDELVWFLENSPLFLHTVLAFASKFLFENNGPIRKNIENARKKGEEK